MTDTHKRYQSRMQKVLDYIDLHLDDCLDLDTLSGVAAFSKYHFHRQFMATFNLPLNRYVQLARMKRASYKLAFRERETITDIAMDAGYTAPDAFARVFRQRVGQQPSSFRKAPDWERWSTTFKPLHIARNSLMPTLYQPSDVQIRRVAATTVAIMEHRGDPSTLGTTIQRFIAWRRSVGLIPPISPTFNVFHADPHTTPRKTIAWIYALERTSRSCRTGKRSRKAAFRPVAVQSCGSRVQAMISNPPRRFCTGSGCRPVVRNREISRSIASA